MTDSPQYIHHDYSAINNHINGVQSHLTENTRAQRAATFSIYAKYGAFALVGLGLFILLVSWGASLLKNPKIVTVTKIIEKPIAYKPTIYVNTDGPDNTIRRAAEAKLGVIKDSADVTEGKSVFNYVIFRLINFDAKGLSSIMVGMKYDDQNSERASNQWCYIETEGGTSKPFSKKISLSKVTGSKRNDVPLTYEDALSMGVDLSTLRTAQQKCVFQ